MFILLFFFYVQLVKSLFLDFKLINSPTKLTKQTFKLWVIILHSHTLVEYDVGTPV